MKCDVNLHIPTKVPKCCNSEAEYYTGEQSIKEMIKIFDEGLVHLEIFSLGNHQQPEVFLYLSYKR